MAIRSIRLPGSGLCDSTIPTKQSTRHSVWALLAFHIYILAGGFNLYSTYIFEKYSSNWIISPSRGWKFQKIFETTTYQYTSFGVNHLSIPKPPKLPTPFTTTKTTCVWPRVMRILVGMKTAPDSPGENGRHPRRIQILEVTLQKTNMAIENHHF